MFYLYFFLCTTASYIFWANKKIGSSSNLLIIFFWFGIIVLLFPAKMLKVSNHVTQPRDRVTIYQCTFLCYHDEPVLFTFVRLGVITFIFDVSLITFDKVYNTKCIFLTQYSANACVLYR